MAHNPLHTMNPEAPFQLQISELYKLHSGKVLASLVRLLGDFDQAEEALHEAFTVAVETWEQQGIPANPTAWLISTGRFKAIDSLRRKKRLGELTADIQHQIDELEEHNNATSEQEIEDDQLRMIFTCCHPAIAANIQIPLTLREVCGLTTEDIASAFLVLPATMAQRIVRGKNKIQQAGIPYEIPDMSSLPERLDAVLSVIYLVFNEGYAASSGDSLLRSELSNEAIRLARLVLALLPDSEVMGLLALMLLHESRRDARTDHKGNIILLEDQDKTLWHQNYIDEGTALVRQALASGRIGAYSIQAAIAAVHAEAKETTDWDQIISLYSVLLRVEPSPVIELNRAVAVAMRDGPLAGLKLIDNIVARNELPDYHKLHTTRAELLSRSGQTPAAINAFKLALSLVKLAPERRFIQEKLASLQAQ